MSKNQPDVAPREAEGIHQFTVEKIANPKKYRLVALNQTPKGKWWERSAPTTRKTPSHRETHTQRSPPSNLSGTLRGCMGQGRPGQKTGSRRSPATQADTNNRLANYFPIEFEGLIAALFQAKGYRAFATRVSHDAGIDVVACSGRTKTGTWSCGIRIVSSQNSADILLKSRPGAPPASRVHMRAGPGRIRIVNNIGQGGQRTKTPDSVASAAENNMPDGRRAIKAGGDSIVFLCKTVRATAGPAHYPLRHLGLRIRSSVARSLIRPASFRQRRPVRAPMIRHGFYAEI